MKKKEFMVWHFAYDKAAETLCGKSVYQYPNTTDENKIECEGCLVALARKEYQETGGVPFDDESRPAGGE